MKFEVSEKDYKLIKRRKFINLIDRLVSLMSLLYFIVNAITDGDYAVDIVTLFVLCGAALNTVAIFTKGIMKIVRKLAYQPKITRLD